MLVTAICSKCHQEKPVEEFHKNRAKRTGHTSSCAQCLNETTRLNWHKYVKEKEERALPKYRCDKCHVITQLDFDPAKDLARWSYFECPNCNQNVEA